MLRLLLIIKGFGSVCKVLDLFSGFGFLFVVSDVREAGVVVFVGRLRGFVEGGIRGVVLGRFYFVW